ncbi:MAG: UMP kinase [Rickettsiales bacterium]|nr:UMP kinase [Rickettsiales bacterium]
MTKKKFKRVLLKISGEALMGDTAFGIDLPTVQNICKNIKKVYEQGHEICLVTGGGNIFRGVSVAAEGMERASADYMGMLATVINALSIQNCLESMGIPTRVQSAIPMTTVCEPYARRRAMRHMEKKRIVIFAGGTGSPFFTTDTTATLRAIEMNCDAVLKGSQVDGVYSSDPKTNENASRFNTLTYKDVLTKDLKVMDSSAIAMARDNHLPIIVFSIQEPEALAEVVDGKGKFTIIS